MRIPAALLLASLPFASFAACSIYNPSLLGAGGSASTSATGSTTTASDTSSASGMGGDTGAGGDMATGTGGAKTCGTVADCPGTDTECRTRTCKGGLCALDFAADGKVLAAQTAKDCLQVVCDGLGAPKSIPDDADLPDDGNDCTDDTCAAGLPAHAPKALGAACAMSGGTKCTADAKCVECVDPSTCPVSHVCNDLTHVCAPAGCGDMVKNGGETDVDCGGAACPKCATGKDCAAGTDCVGGACTGLVCAPTCFDGLKNNGESDVDCGGTCAAKCDIAQACTGGGDCKTGSCVAKACSCANDHLVISEIRSRGTTMGQESSDEFIELYNPTGAAVTLGASWTIQVRSTTSGSYAVRWTGTGKTLGSHKHFLLANPMGYTQMPAADELTATAGITDATSILLINGGATVDAVCYGFSAATKTALMAMGYTCEGAPADNLPHNNGTGASNADVSIQRLPGGALGNCIDTGDNAADFITTTPAVPQSSTSPATP